MDIMGIDFDPDSFDSSESDPLDIEDENIDYEEVENPEVFDEPNLDITTEDEVNLPLSQNDDLPEFSQPQEGREISFTGGAGRCSWCYGQGYTYFNGRNVKCTHCGGSGVGS